MKNTTSYPISNPDILRGIESSSMSPDQRGQTDLMLGRRYWGSLIRSMIHTRIRFSTYKLNLRPSEPKRNPSPEKDSIYRLYGKLPRAMGLFKGILLLLSVF